MIHDQITLPGPFEAAVERVTEALAAEGFGIISRIDLAQAFRDKLGTEFRPFLILGACNPGLAHRAVGARPEIGLMLPCNVTVEAAGEGVLVRLPDARAMMAAAGPEAAADLEPLGEDAAQRLEGVAARLRGQG
ncbi:MAG: DUF302 domain-containing protein [Sphingomonadaceae bacterium]